MTLDDVSFTTKIVIHSGGGAIAPYTCVALFDTGSPTFIRRDVLIVCFGRRHLGGVRAALQPSFLV